MPRRRTLSAAICLAALPGLAAGGAWTQPEGQGQIILSGSIGVAPVFGVSNDVGDTESSFTSLFVEYGVMEGLTVGGTAFIELPEGSRTDNTANIGLLARKRLWQGDRGDVASVQVGFVQPLDDVMGDSYGGPGTDQTHELSLRLLYGRGFGGDWGTAFVSTEGGFHKQLDGDEDELRVDATAGYAAKPCCLWMLSGYATLPLGDADDASLRLGPSFAYSLRRDPTGEEGDGDAPPEPEKVLTLQLGISQDVLNIEDGFGVQLGIWRPF